MERQKNYKERLASAASTRYRSTYDGYLRHLSRGDWMTMRAYCRISHTDYRGMPEWLGATGLPVPARPSFTAAAEDESFEPVFSHVRQGVTWNRTAKEKIELVVKLIIQFGLCSFSTSARNEAAGWTAPWPV